MIQQKQDIKKGMVPYVLLLIIGILIMFFYSMMSNNTNELTYDEFSKALNKKEIKEITITPSTSAYTYELTGKLKGYEKGETFVVKTPLSDSIINKIIDASDENGFKVTAKADPASSTWLVFLLNVAPYLLLIGVAFWFFTRQVNNNKGSMDFGKSKAKLNADKGVVTFKDVAGLPEEKEELQELIDFLKTPKKFQKLGARIPKGVLLVGPPGTGKTLLAKAVAGEANAPFYFISGSDFVELYVGVGASRVRDMFKQAKHNAPCLIFIDEIDAVGRQRGTGIGGGHDEREQTLNQLLTEMDGFGANEGIIIIAATNRPDVLDPALLRPGRFDRQVTVALPDIKARTEILKVHAKNKVMAKSVNLHNIARRCVGFSGADLENLLNEAALLAVRREKNAITMSEIDEAIDRVIMGPAKLTKKYTDNEKKLVAYHEAGHAVLGIKLDDANDVQKVTIIPRGQAGGYNLMMPKEEKYTATKTELLEQIMGLLGGRVAEEVVFNEITTGAHNDFEQATKIARSMVTEYGMSSLGPVQLETRSEGAFLGRDYNKNRNFSDQVALEIDNEVRTIINGCYDKAKLMVIENRKLLDLLATTLIECETLTKEQIDYLAEYGKMPEEELLDDLSLAKLKEMAKEKEIAGYSSMNKEELKKAISED
ncbi:MAG: ATP-dependent zinc metalloprotease FtsH [Bacilli bacterium]